jgi:hypothetical protein
LRTVKRLNVSFLGFRANPGLTRKNLALKTNAHPAPFLCFCHSGSLSASLKMVWAV